MEQDSIKNSTKDEFWICMKVTNWKREEGPLGRAEHGPHPHLPGEHGKLVFL